NALFVIARVLHDRRVFGIEPVERLASDGQGRLFTLETNATDRLPGITGAGQYLVVQVNEPQGLIQGITRNSASEPAGGLVVRLAPWTTLSRVPDGFFQLIAPAGEHEVSLSDPGTADVGSETVT